MSLADMAGGFNNSIQQQLAKRLQAQAVERQIAQQEFANQQTVNDATQRATYQNAMLADNAANRASMAEDREIKRGGELNEAILGGTVMDASDPLVPALRKGGGILTMQGMDGAAPPEMLAANGDDQQPQELPGTFPMSPMPGMGLRTVTKANSAKQQNTIDDNERARLLAEAAGADKVRNDTRLDNAATETARHNRVIENKPAGGGGGLWVTRNGQTVRVREGEVQPGDTPAGQRERSTGEERKNAGFYQQMQKAVAVIDELEDKVGEKELYQLQTLPQDGLVGMANRGEMSEAGKRYLQAFEQFTEARLRPVSGAAISDGEYARDRRTYAKQYGETPALGKQRREARQSALTTGKLMAGTALPDEAAGGGGPVKMITPDGRPLTVPADRVAEMEAKGAKRRVDGPS